MSARFRIRTTQGQELSFASKETFEEFVRSGDLAEDDVVYDAETREWATARTHPVVLQIEMEAEEEVGQASVEGEPEGSDLEDEGEETAAAASSGLEALNLELAPAPDTLSPEEQAAAFVKKMEAERAADLDFDAEPSIESFMTDPSSATLHREVTPPPPTPDLVPAPPVEPRPKPKRERKEPPKPEARDTPREPIAERPAPEPPQRTKKEKRAKKEKKARKPKKAGSGAGRRYAPFVIVGTVLVAAAVYLGPELMDSSSDQAQEEVLPPEPVPLIPDTDEALRERAIERFLASTQAELRALEPIPSIWLQGRYLANPSDYPDVPRVWQSYLDTIRRVQQGDDDRYRAAYVRALDDALVEGPDRATRLSRAMSNFQAAGAARRAHYERVARLASAALSGHAALVEAEGTISYEPATGPRVSADPVIEAAGRTADAQALLERVLDVILAELQGEGGPGDAPNVREWVWDGVLGSVAR